MQFTKLYIILVTGLVLFTSNSCFSQNYSSRISVVGNSFDTIEYTKKEIRSILKGDLNNWNNGNRVIVVLALDIDEVSEHITEEIYSKSVKAAKKYWLGLVFQGRFEAPIFVSTNEEVLDAVNRNIGAIGVLADYNGNLNANLLLNIIE
jgi:hypothetical protein